MLEVWEGGGLEEENKRLVEVVEGKEQEIIQMEAEIDQKSAENDQLRAEISTLRRRLIEKGEVEIGVDRGGSKEGCQSRDPEPASSEAKSKTN